MTYERRSPQQLKRASIASYFDRNGVRQDAPANRARYDYDPATGALLGFLTEDRRTNMVRNNTMQGAALGALSTSLSSGVLGRLPAGWAWVASSNLQMAIVGIGVEDGIPYLDARVFGTASSTSACTMPFDSYTFAQVAGGEAWSASVFARLIAGSLAGLASMRIGMRELDGAGAFVQELVTYMTPTAARLAAQRYAVSGNTAAATRSISGRMLFYPVNGAAIDFTIRIGMPQLEQATAPSSVIATAPTFTGRPSVATYFDESGVLRDAAAGVARYNYDPITRKPIALLLEPQRTNSVRNNAMQGAAAGAPGTLPSNWVETIGGGITRQVVGVGVQNGINYIDVRYTGTPTSTSYNAIAVETSSGVAAAVGQAWMTSMFVALVAGSWANVTSQGIGFVEYSSTGTALASGVGTNITPNAALTRYEYARTLVNASTTKYVNNFRWNYVNTTTPVDFTLRIGLPQMELGAYSTTPIKTTGAAATRSADTYASAAVTREADEPIYWTFSPLLPPNATPQERTMETATARIGGVPALVKDLWNVDTCPLEFLPWLAWAFGVDEWQDDWAEESKRATIREAVMVQRRKGSIWSIRRALENAGFGNSVLQESIAGGQPTWASYTCVLEKPISNAQAAQVRRILAAIAPARCQLYELNFNVANNTYNGAINYDGAYNFGTA